MHTEITITIAEMWANGLVTLGCGFASGYIAGKLYRAKTSTVVVPKVCNHPFKKWEVLTWEEIPNRSGGVDKIPATWYCTDCGYTFTKERQCPECHMDMEITEWMDLFPGRFRCSICGVYYFHEELDGLSDNKPSR